GASSLVVGVLVTTGMVVPVVLVVVVGVATLISTLVPGLTRLPARADELTTLPSAKASEGNCRSAGPPVSGHEILPVDGHEVARWRPRELPAGGHQICFSD